MNKVMADKKMLMCLASIAVINMLMCKKKENE